MNQYGKKKSTPQSKMTNCIIVILIIVFAALGVIAVYPKIAENRKTNAILNGEAEQTVEYMANNQGMSVEDFLAQYGLSTNDGITGESTETDMVNNMSIENYLSYTGQTQTADELIAQVNMQDKVTKDSKWADFMNILSTAQAVDVVGGEEAFNQLKEQYGLGDDVTPSMPYADFEQALYAKQSESAAAANAAENAEATPSTADATTAPAAE